MMTYWPVTSGPTNFRAAGATIRYTAAPVVMRRTRTPSTAAPGHDRLFGGPGDDTLYGSEGDDMLKGGPGADTLEGNSGDDILEGGAGADTMDGGIGFDTFVFDSGHGMDTITDFRNGTDLIDIRAFGLPGFDDLSFASDADGVTIDLTDNGGGTILLEGFDIANLDATDFLF